MRNELLALQINGTWSLTSLLTGKKAIGCKSMFEIKENPDGTIHKHKARLMLRVSIKVLDLTSQKFSAQ